LANVFEATGRSDKAEARYREILHALPQHIPTLKRFAEFHERSGNSDTAAAYFKKAWDLDPKNIETAIAYAMAIQGSNPAETSATLDRLLADYAHDDEMRIKILSNLLIFKEFHEREKRGLMPHHATSISELFFTYCAADFALFRDLALKAASERPNDMHAVLTKFVALFCSRDNAGAEATLAQLRTRLGKHPLGMVRLDPAFYHALESESDEVLFAGLPPLINVRAPVFTGAHITYLSCNFRYFVDFAIPLLRSFADRTPGGQAHVHIMDATDEELRDIAAFCAGLSRVTVAVSAEKPGVDKKGGAPARSYYHSVRFVRFYQHLKQYGRTLWMMDVDALFNRDANEMYSVIGDKDAAFRIRAGRIDPWNQFSAAVIGATGKPASVAYFRLIAAYIAHFHKHGQLQWGIDQFAMYGAYMFLQDKRAPDVAFLGSRVMDQDYLPEGIVWFTAGRKKYSRPTADGSAVSQKELARMRYWALLDKYKWTKDDVAT
jgi:hypothetical protein